MENRPNVRLTFTCNRNWEDMIAVEGGRFCNDCQKKVVDFTNKTPDEIATYLNSATKVCGKFSASQLVTVSPQPAFKRWLSTAAMFVAVFIGIKEASAQTTHAGDSTSSTYQKNKNNKYSLGGEIVLVRNYNIPTPVQTQEVYSFADLETLPSFSGGEEAFTAYLNKNIHAAAGIKGRIIVSMIIDKTGSLTNIKVLRGVNAEADQEVVRVLTASPKWNPGKIEGKAVAVKYTMPVNIGK